jgi:hypothetical protein
MLTILTARTNVLICFDEGPDEKGQQLMSGCCSCHGTAGYLHLSCAVKNSQAKTKSAVESGGIDGEALSLNT